MITVDALTARCAADGEFGLSSKGWDGGLLVRVGDDVTGFTMRDGHLSAELPSPGTGVIVLDIPAPVWDGMTQAMPPVFHNDVSAAFRLGVTRQCDEILWWQYMPATQRALELCRAEAAPQPPAVTRTTTSPIGRYRNLDVGGTTYRVFYEEAGTGIPLVLQHTAGAHSMQWRHLFEMPEITDHFRLIAYDLPFHGKSVPPTGPDWWAEPYRLRGAFLKEFVTAFANALELDDPVFMGCSVGGLLALDLALNHPDRFHSVVSVQGALHIGGKLEQLPGFHHPQVSNESKARMMEGLTAPQSPVELRKETIQTYAAGWPPAFIGDLAYYAEEFDIREQAGEIDTGRIGVHILTGEYDPSATVEHGQAAHDAIAGSTFAVMPELGHFPMSENPDRFAEYLLPVLDSIRTTREIA